MSFRQFAPTKFDGEVVEIKTLAQRKALIGKRVGYDLRGSSYAHYGTVTGQCLREIEIDGSFISINQIEQLAVLREQSAWMS